METAQASPRAASATGAARRIDWSGVAFWLLGFSLVAYLGLKGGGYDPLVHDQVGIAVWWVLLVAVAVGAAPRRRLGTLAWCGLGLLAAFVIWTALSLTWTESVERTSADLARVAGYLGAFTLALFARGSGGARRMVGALASAIALIAIVALLSRLHPAWFPNADQIANFLSSGRERLSYPLNYWNALAALIAIGMPLLLQAATEARSLALRALAAASLPALMLAALFTLSRGGIAAVFLSLAVYLALTSDRLPKLLTLLVAAGGGAILVATAIGDEALRHGLDNAAAHDQGNQMLLLTIVVCLVVGGAQAAIAAALDRGLRPSWTRPSRGQSQVVLAVAAVAALVALAAVDAPSRIANGWDEFKRPELPGKGTERLGRASGESRYQFWSSAVREAESKPLTGTGSGTFVFWWTRDGDTGDVVRDAHSLYFQTLGELGIVGLALILAFLGVVLVGGGVAAVRAGPGRRPALAAAVAGCTAFFATAIFDWMWQMPVLALAMLLLASILITSGDGDGTEREPAPFGLTARVAVAVVALLAIAVIAIPLASTTLLRQSQSDAAAGRLGAALGAAKSAQNVQPDAASPRLQEALVLETAGDFDAAAAAARAAAEREPTNWRPWLVLSRIEAERGRTAAAIAAYREARSLAPHSTIFPR